MAAINLLAFLEEGFQDRKLRAFDIQRQEVDDVRATKSIEQLVERRRRDYAYASLAAFVFVQPLRAACVDEAAVRIAKEKILTLGLFRIDYGPDRQALRPVVVKLREQHRVRFDQNAVPIEVRFQRQRVAVVMPLCPRSRRSSRCDGRSSSR